MRSLIFILAAAIFPLTGLGQESPVWKAGAAVVDITPEGPVWMAGYGRRDKPSEGVAQKVYAKALALADQGEGRMVIVTLDLIGVPRELREAVVRRSAERHGLAPEEILLNASHTHSGPSPRGRGVRESGLRWESGCLWKSA